MLEAVIFGLCLVLIVIIVSSILPAKYTKFTPSDPAHIKSDVSAKYTTKTTAKAKAAKAKAAKAAKAIRLTEIKTAKNYLDDSWSKAFPNLAYGYPYNYNIDDTSENTKLYSTDEVDALITGQLYAGPRTAGVGRRLIYGANTSYGNKWGMREFSAGNPGETGVNIGPLGMQEYSPDGNQDIFDDGIPEEWQMPSTPMRWHHPQEGDYYDPNSQGPALQNGPSIIGIREPDHEPLFT
jgi:hypothetical protein